MNYIENNGKIADFVDAIKEQGQYDLFSCAALSDVFADVDASDPDAKHYYAPIEMEFHSSWDWLMPVVEKIETLKVKGIDWINPDNKKNVTWNFTVEIRHNECIIHRDVIPHYWGGEINFLNLKDMHQNKLEAVYKAILKFIEWYNEHKPGKI